MKSIKYYLFILGVILSINACQKESLPLNPVLNPTITGLVLTVNGLDYIAVPQIDANGHFTSEYILAVRIPSNKAVVKQISFAEEGITANIKAGDEVIFIDNELNVVVSKNSGQEHFSITMSFNPPPFMYLIKTSDTDSKGNRYFLNEEKADRIASGTYNNHFEGYVDLTRTNWDNIGLVLSDKTFFYDFDGGWWQGETSGAFDMTKEKAGTSGFFPTKGPWANWILINDNPKITSPGVWKINFDTETNIMSMVEVQWSIIGSSAPNNPLLNYYPDEKVWKASLNLNAGSFKFATIPVSFGDPTVTYGKSESISPLASDGEEIKITESGSYEVILNLNNPPYYNYQLTKK